MPYIRTIAITMMMLALAAAACAQAPNAEEQNKTAGETFKNIQFLKQVPATQLIPTMNFIANSLGVECNFCHVTIPIWSPELDDKQNKKTARKMMAMMSAINQQNFEGKQLVTCATCHQGHPRPAVVPPLMDIAQAAAATAPVLEAGDPSKLPSVNALFEKYVKAIGGADKVEKLTTEMAKGTATTSDNKTVQFEIYRKAPDKLLLRTTQSDGSETLQGFDGTRAWAKNARGVRELLGGRADEVRIEAQFSRGLDPAPLYQSAVVRHRASLGGREVYLIAATPKGASGISELLYFDAESGLLLRRTQLTQTALGNLPDEDRYSDYRETQGVKVPFAMQQATPEDLIDRKFTEIKFNQPIDDARFAMPADNP